MPLAARVLYVTPKLRLSNVPTLLHTRLCCASDTLFCKKAKRKLDSPRPETVSDKIDQKMSTDKHEDTTLWLPVQTSPVNLTGANNILSLHHAGKKRSAVPSFRVLLLVVLLFANSATVSSAFVVVPKGQQRHTQPSVHHKPCRSTSPIFEVAIISALSPTITYQQRISSLLLFAANADDDNNDNQINSHKQPPLTHNDIIWKIRPLPEATRRERLQWKLSANILRWECRLLRKPLPTVLCPNNFPQIVLEAHHVNGTKMARFGISSRRGPSAPPIGATVEELYGIDPGFAANLGIAAIVYMFVEPPFRGRNVGSLALEVIALIHATAVNADFTILVADDKSSDQRLVQWYEKHGYARAPLLQDMMGSPNEEYGVSMIAPTNGTGVPEGCRIQWW